MTLMSDHPELRVWLRGNLLWDERYAVETVSPLRMEQMRERMLNTHRALRDAGMSETWVLFPHLAWAITEPVVPDVPEPGGTA